ncbi:MAG: hypothetical protein RMK43_11575 [Cyclobacteriaceae bacterium]|nr:hypothetical protein [Cyclobacteriaceae bacterium]
MAWWALHTVLIVILARFAWKKQDGPIRAFFWPAGLVKILATVAVLVIHRYYYPESDMFFFYDRATQLSQRAVSDFPGFLNSLFTPASGYYPGEARTEFFVKLLSLVALFTHHNVLLMSLWLSLMSFFASWHLVQVITKWQPAWKWPAIVAFLFYPSVVFWTSGIMKETLAMAGIYFIMTVFLKLWTMQRPAWWEYILLVLSVWVAWKLKYYYVAVLMPVLLAALVTRALGRKMLQITKVREMFLFAATFFLLILLPGFFHPNLRPARLIQVVAENHNHMVMNAGSTHLTGTEIIEPHITDIASHILPGLAYGLFAPYTPDFTHGFYMLSVIENWLMIFVTVCAVPALFFYKNDRERVLLWAALAFCIVLACWLGVAVPAAGTLVRYKVGFLSCWVLLVLLGAKNTWVAVQCWKRHAMK